MAKLQRKSAKLFAENAAADVGGVAQFGSLAAGEINYSKDPDVIQALSEYQDGWSAAVTGNKSPALEDRNALDYLLSYQQAYIMQRGVPEWIATETYYQGSFVSQSDGKMYVSKIDNNTNHDPSYDTNETYWLRFPTPAEVAAKVAKAGDTMTGQLDINKNQTHLKLLDSNVNSVTTPSSAVYGNYIDFAGTTDGALGRIACRSGAEGNDLLFQAFDGDNSHSTSIGVRISKDGSSSYAYAPTPSANASGLEIATAAWVRSLLTSGGSDGTGWFQQWVRFPNGLQICWGNTAAGITTVTFPMPFKDATVSIIQGDLYSTRTDRMTYAEKRINSWSATGFVYEWAGIQRAYVALGFWK